MIFLRMVIGSAKLSEIDALSEEWNEIGIGNMGESGTVEPNMAFWK